MSNGAFLLLSLPTRRQSSYSMASSQARTALQPLVECGGLGAQTSSNVFGVVDDGDF
jgi:hypothetical protein